MNKFFLWYFKTSALSSDRSNLTSSFYIKTDIKRFTIAQIIDKSVEILVLNT